MPTSSVYNLSMDIQQNIHLIIFERFAKECIEFAYSTQKVHMARAEEPAGQEAG